MEIEKIDMAGLIQMVLTIGAHWSPLELEIEKRDMNELIQNQVMAELMQFSIR